VTTRIWLDSHGHIFEAPADAHTCRDYEGRPLTHRLWHPNDPNVLVPATVCGQHAGAIPGDDVVDCPDCLAIEGARGSASDQAPMAPTDQNQAQPRWD
jgi:hypothetical protein